MLFVHYINILRLIFLISSIVFDGKRLEANLRKGTEAQGVSTYLILKAVGSWGFLYYSYLVERNDLVLTYLIEGCVYSYYALKCSIRYKIKTGVIVAFFILSVLLADSFLHSCLFYYRHEDFIKLLGVFSCMCSICCQGVPLYSFMINAIVYGWYIIDTVAYALSLSTCIISTYYSFLTNDGFIYTSNIAGIIIFMVIISESVAAVISGRSYIHFHK